MKLIKGNKIISATEKAYDVVYKNLGYEIYNDNSIDSFTKAEILEILNDNGIEHNPRDKKEVLYDLMVEGDFK